MEKNVLYLNKCKKLPVAIGIVCLCLFTSCSGGGGGSVSKNSSAGHTPFVISIPECKIGSLPGCYAHCGVHFSYTNTSTKDVERIKISCMVYSDKNGTNPFIGSNHILADFPDEGISNNIASGESRNFILNLDPYIYSTPAAPFFIDYFFVRKVTFTDGSTFEDPFGTYHVKSW
ncbi:MAG: hypothetical protein GX297_08515 [Treponema sp.]|mgnify:CR=1 FL=1|jgi:hypothetical protein|nr:hypothetical protein [Treponema sp.]